MSCRAVKIQTEPLPVSANISRRGEALRKCRVQEEKRARLFIRSKIVHYYGVQKKISGAVLTVYITFKMCRHVNEIHKKYILEVNSKNQLNIRFVFYFRSQNGYF
jgi:hypothetical protein